MSLELRGVVKRAGTETHVYETSVKLVETGFNILLGPTRAGKTTLIQLMAGLERPTAGEVWFNGKNVTGVPVQKRNVSVVYQQFINYPNLTVYENIASPLRVARMQRTAIRDRVHRVAELLKLTPLLQRQPVELSGGQQQRTALARALVKDADLVFLDEPLVNLDFKLREELRDELPKLLADRNCAVVYATTEPTDALLLGGHTAAVHEGRIMQFGATAELYRRPANLATARAFSDLPINTASVIKQGDRLILSDTVSWMAGSALSGRPDGRYTLAVRPHRVGLTRPGRDSTMIEGRVQLAELSGSDSVIHFSHGGLSWVSQSHGVHPIEVGAPAPFYLDIAECMYFGADGERVGVSASPG